MAGSSAPTHPDRGSSAVTSGIRVTVRPQYLPDQSKPQLPEHRFSYHITIRNESADPVRLKRRHWLIVDADGDEHEVDGDGVLGHTPRLEPGEQFEYASHCALSTPWGTMEGEYLFERDDGDTLTAQVARFYLVAE